MAEPCIHDLDPATCAVCNGAGQRAAASRPEAGPWVKARFDGWCSTPDCRVIVAGDAIRSDGNGGWLCDGCGSDE